MKKILKPLLLAMSISAIASVVGLSLTNAGLLSTSLESGSQPSESHIKVVREMFLESGIPVDPHSIVKTRDDGYVVAGSIGGNPAWATRIDSAGRVVWRYVMPSISGTDSTMKSSYAAAVQLPDDSTLLCGSAITTFKEVPQWNEFRLLTHISKGGEVIGQIPIDPANDKSFEGSDIRYCVPYRAGAVAVGITSRPAGVQSHDTYMRMLILDSQAHRVDDHVIHGRFGVHDAVTFGQAVVLVADSALAGARAHMEPATRLLSFDDSGEIVHDRTIRGGGFYLEPVKATESFYLFLETGTESKVQTLGSRFEDVSSVNGPLEDLFPTKAYRLDEGDIVVFGETATGVNARSASVTWLEADLRNKQVFLFEPRFTSFAVGSTTLTGKPNEFITARGVFPRGLPGTELDRTGLALTVFSVQ